MSLDPQCTRHNHPVLIHAQSLDRCSARWRQLLDSLRVINPAKMFAPVLGAGIKQGYSLFRFRIWASSSGCFAEIARRTGEAQIFEIVAATGINMLNMQRLADRRLARLTVFTAIPCAVVDKADNRGPGQFTHRRRKDRLRSWYIPVQSARRRPWLSVDSTVAPVQSRPQVLPAGEYSVFPPHLHP